MNLTVPIHFVSRVRLSPSAKNASVTALSVISHVVIFPLTICPSMVSVMEPGCAWWSKSLVCVNVQVPVTEYGGVGSFSKKGLNGSVAQKIKTAPATVEEIPAIHLSIGSPPRKLGCDAAPEAAMLPSGSQRPKITIATRFVEPMARPRKRQGSSSSSSQQYGAGVVTLGANTTEPFEI